MICDLGSFDLKYNFIYDTETLECRLGIADGLEKKGCIISLNKLMMLVGLGSFVNYAFRHIVTVAYDNTEVDVVFIKVLKPEKLYSYYSKCLKEGWSTDYFCILSVFGEDLLIPPVMCVYLYNLSLNEDYATMRRTCFDVVYQGRHIEMKNNSFYPKRWKIY